MKEIDKVLETFSDACNALSEKDNLTLFDQLNIDLLCSGTATRIHYQITKDDDDILFKNHIPYLEETALILREVIQGACLTSYIIGFRNGKRKANESR